MLRLGGGTHFLVLRRTSDFTGHLVSIVARFDETLPAWEAGSRISPVFPTLDEQGTEASIPRFSDGKQRWLVFLGPVHPGAIQVTPGTAIFLSLGLFNVIASCDSPEQVAQVKAFAANTIRWETWELSGHELRTISFSPVSGDLQSLPSEITNPIPAEPPTLKPTAREYSTLIASTLSRARLFSPSAVPDLVQFDKVFRELLRRTPDPVTRHGYLVVTNAALSRYSSQTFAGTSPILETECHFWTHSLLGVGVASQALQRIRQAIDRTIENSRLIDRILHLQNVKPQGHELTSLPTQNDFWSKDYAFESSPPYEAPTAGSLDDEPLPVITCFSGRDGFRSTDFSLSAPLEVITGCGTTSWTLQTITHEMSHTVVAGILAVLLPKPNQPDDVTGLFELLRDPKTAKSLFDQVRAFLAFSIWKLNPPGTTHEDMTVPDLAHRLRTHWQEVNEIITHVFDFLYFYRQDGPRYIESIWASWGVIPNIDQRVENYVLRSLCALHANNLRREDCVAITIDELRECLVRARERFPNALYIPSAITELETRRTYYSQHLYACSRLVQFVRTFLYSPRVAQLLMSETVAVGGKEVYAFAPLSFSDERIGNPLRFIDEHTDHKQPEHRQALWMLVQLAFAELK